MTVPFACAHRPGSSARTSRGVVDLAAVARVLGEVAIPERAFLDGLELEGDLRAVLLVENLGAWRDLPAPEGFLLAHVPGWDTATVAHLLDHVAHVPVLHFGDLDPNGVRIYLHLRERRPDLRWFVPAFWAELVDSHGLRAPWPADLDVRAAPALVRDLAARGLWLEQERIVVDHRIERGTRVGGKRGGRRGTGMSEYQCYEFVALDRPLTREADGRAARDLDARGDLADALLERVPVGRPQGGPREAHGALLRRAPVLRELGHAPTDAAHARRRAST